MKLGMAKFFGALSFTNAALECDFRAVAMNAYGARFSFIPTRKMDPRWSPSLETGPDRGPHQASENNRKSTAVSAESGARTRRLCFGRVKLRQNNAERKDWSSSSLHRLLLFRATVSFGVGRGRVHLFRNALQRIQIAITLFPIVSL